MVLHHRNFWNSMKKSWKSAEKSFSRSAMCIKNEIRNCFFSRIRKLDIDMMRDDIYVKVSPGSTLQSSNNGLAISYNLGQKSGIFWASKQICCKKRISNFFEKYRNLMSTLKLSLWNVSESKTTPETYLQDAGGNMHFEKINFFQGF